MRVGGLATGMEIDSMVEQLMEAERIPLERMKQDQTSLVWKQDAFRKVNRSLLALDELMFDMKLSSTYQSKIVHSANENAVTATANTSVSDGAYSLKVNRLATNAIHVGKLDETIDPTDSLKDLNIIHEDTTITLATYDENGEMIEQAIDLKQEDSFNDALQKITTQVDNVRAFFDHASSQVVLETTRTGAFNEDGPEINYDHEHDFFKQLGLHTANESGGTNAEFTYNNELELVSKTNNYTLNGINFEFHQTTEENTRITVNTDIDHTVDLIKEFTQKYNEAIDLLNGSQQEERYRDYPPLTDIQKNEMTEDEITQWEEKAKSGILRGEYSITQGMNHLRQGWTTPIETDGAYSTMTEIGLSTTNRYMDGGKIEVDENELREALLNHPEDVRQLFVSTDDHNKGLIYRVEKAVDQTMSRIEDKAGRSTHTLENYTLGRQRKNLDERIAQFEERMARVETRYWNQFTEMEKAIQQMNDQSALLFSQFNDL